MRELNTVVAVTIGLLMAWLGQDPRWLFVGAIAGLWLWEPFLHFLKTSQRKLDVALFATALGAFVLGFRVEGVQLPGNVYWSLGWASLPVTVLWVLLVGQALRFVERMGGARLALQVAWVVCAAFALMVLLQPQTLLLAQTLSIMALALISWMLLKSSNNQSQKVSAVGVLLALITMAGMVKTSATVMLLAPVLILGLPPLTLNQSLGIITKVSVRRIQPQQWLSLYGLLCAVSVLGVTWMHRPDWLWAMSLGLLPALGVLVLGLRPVLPDEWAANSKQICLFGVSVNRVCAGLALEKVSEFVKSKRPHIIATPDTTMVMHAKSDSTVRGCYDLADLVTPDGTGIVWASRWLGSPLAERVTGIDLMQSICERAANEGWKVFLLGAQPQVVTVAGHRLQRAYKNLQIVGTHHGYFMENEARVIEQIRAAQPDILLVGMGAPLQEQWLIKHKHTLGVSVMMGVGGSFDVWAGRLKRAPKWMQQAGLEWAFRLLLEPKRIARVLKIPVFMLMVLRLKGSMWFHRWIGSDAQKPQRFTTSN